MNNLIVNYDGGEIYCARMDVFGDTVYCLIEGEDDNEEYEFPLSELNSVEQK